eukprot:12245940-Alexandrium_andersonii.AAC.1
MYAQARRAALAGGHSVPGLPFPPAVRPGLFGQVPNREVDAALGVQERRVEAADAARLARPAPATHQPRRPKT